MSQYESSVTSNFLESPDVHPGPRKDGDPGGNEEFSHYRP